MLNPKTGERELCYVTVVDAVSPIEGYDRVELAHVGGWSIVVGKGEFHAGDPAIYFEIDSKLPEVAPFINMEFLAKKKYKIKTQKMCKSISQGLLMSAANFGWHIVEGGNYAIVDNNGNYHRVDEESRFLTKQLGVTYNVAEDNARKASKPNPNAKYQSMINRHPWMYKNHFTRWMLKHNMGKKILFVFFGKAADNQRGFPTKFPFVHRTDEERIENMPWVLNDKEPWIVTTKIDGTSSTYIMERIKKNKFEYYVCSRNVRMLKPTQESFHNEKGDVNVYWQMSDKYHIEEALRDLLIKHPDWTYVCLQGETAGQNLQGNPHKFPDVRFFGFNLIDSKTGRWNSVDAAELMKNDYNIPWVPIVNKGTYILPDTMEEMKAQAEGPCEAPGASGLREGYVYRSLDGQKSFKNVSTKYLLKKGE